MYNCYKWYKIPKENELVIEILNDFPEVKTIVKNVNNKNTNVIMGEENINLYGNGYIEDILGEYIFKYHHYHFIK